jgi:heptosyltransferase-2
VKCVVIQTAFLGDVILTVPLLQKLAASPSVEELAVVAGPVGVEFLATQGVADRLIDYDKRGKDAGPRGLAGAVRRIRAVGADVAIVAHRSFRSALLPFLASVPSRVGFDESGGRCLLTRRVRYRGLPHEIDRIAALAGPAGLGPVEAPLPLRLSVPGPGEAEVARSLDDTGGGRGLLVVAPGSRWATKRWPPERFAEAAARLAGEAGLRVVVTGGPDDRVAADAVARGVGEDAADLAGGLSLGGLLALVARASLVLSNDSAAAHVAAGLGTPVVAIFGPTVPGQGFAPRGEAVRIVGADLPCRPCGRHGGEHCRLGTHACMEEVTADAVVDAGRSLLAGEVRS